MVARLRNGDVGGVAPKHTQNVQLAGSSAREAAAVSVSVEGEASGVSAIGVAMASPPHGRTEGTACDEKRVRALWMPCDDAIGRAGATGDDRCTNT